MQTTIAQHGLHDVSHHGDEEPERSPEPCHASGLRHQEGEERRNEADGKAQTVDEPGIEVMELFPEGDAVLLFPKETVGGGFVRAAQRDEIALYGVVTGGDTAMPVVAYYGVFRNWLPYGLTVLAEMAQAGKFSYECREWRYVFPV